MKLLLPLMVASSAVVSAQNAAVKVRPDDRFSVSVDKCEVVRDVDDFDGIALGAKARVADGLRVAFSYADATSDAFDLTTGPGGVNLELDATRFSLGLEYDLQAGPGKATLSLGYAQTTAEASGEASGDAFESGQFVLGARYDLELGAGFSAAVLATHYAGSFDVESGFAGAGERAALVARYDDSPTSVGLSLAYTPTRLLTFHLTYATEDSLFGLGGADNTISFGVRANF